MQSPEVIEVTKETPSFNEDEWIGKGRQYTKEEHAPLVNNNKGGSRYHESSCQKTKKCLKTIARSNLKYYHYTACRYYCDISIAKKYAISGVRIKFASQIRHPDKNFKISDMASKGTFRGPPNG
jgi:hypothetical protein